MIDCSSIQSILQIQFILFKSLITTRSHNINEYKKTFSRESIKLLSKTGTNPQNNRSCRPSSFPLQSTPNRNHQAFQKLIVTRLSEEWCWLCLRAVLFLSGTGKCHLPFCVYCSWWRSKRIWLWPELPRSGKSGLTESGKSVGPNRWRSGTFWVGLHGCWWRKIRIALGLCNYARIDPSCAIFMPWTVDCVMFWWFGSLTN